MSDLYQAGSLRDMKKWAYELHSTFTVRDAPLAVKLDEPVIGAIENTLKVSAAERDPTETHGVR